MALHQHALRYGHRRLVKRAGRSIPWLGAAIALLAVGSTIRRKGFIRGSVDTALDAIPLVGALKNAAEVVRGRDFFPDRPRKTRDSQLTMQTLPPPPAHT